MKYMLKEALVFLGTCVVVGVGVGITMCIAVSVWHVFIKIMGA